MESGSRSGMVAAFVVAVVGSAAVGLLPRADVAAWVLLGIVGLAAGAVAGRADAAWVGLGGYAIAELAIDLARGESLGPFWYLGIIGRVVVVLVTVVAGSAAGRPPHVATRPWRLVALSLASATLLAVVAYGGYAVVRSGEYLVQGGEGDCRTPAVAFGWAYEAINYDPADDARLMARHPDPRHCFAPDGTADQGMPAGTEVVSADGIHVAGWYIPAAAGTPATGPTLVLVHGGKDNKSGMLGYAAPLHGDYNLVLIDLRNQGRSTGTVSSGGLREALDLRAMIDWLERTRHPAWLGLVGNSNGAATVLAEAIDDPRPQALVLDSMHASVLTQLGNVIETEQHLPAWPAAWALINGASLQLGGDITSVDPERTIGRVGSRPVLLLHGLRDHVDRPADSLERNVAAALAAGVAAEVHVCPAAEHGEVITACQAAWGAWVIDFLAAARGISPA